ncbi:hypothetical protein LMIY3S_02722 [Labrys miyagiensis]
MGTTEFGRKFATTAVVPNGTVPITPLAGVVTGYLGGVNRRKPISRRQKLNLRLGHVIKLLKDRWGGPCDTDDADPFAIWFANALPKERALECINRWCPKLRENGGDDWVTDIIASAEQHPRRLTADDTAQLLRVTPEERLRLKLWTIGSVGSSSRKRRKERAAKKVGEKYAQRRAEGAVPREVYEAHSSERLAAWLFFSRSRRWFFQFSRADRQAMEASAISAGWTGPRTAIDLGSRRVQPMHKDALCTGLTPSEYEVLDTAQKTNSFGRRKEGRGNLSTTPPPQKRLRDGLVGPPLENVVASPAREGSPKVHSPQVVKVTAPEVNDCLAVSAGNVAAGGAGGALEAPPPATHPDMCEVPIILTGGAELDDFVPYAPHAEEPDTLHLSGNAPPEPRPPADQGDGGAASGMPQRHASMIMEDAPMPELSPEDQLRLFRYLTEIPEAEGNYNLARTAVIALSPHASDAKVTRFVLAQLAHRAAHAKRHAEREAGRLDRDDDHRAAMETSAVSTARAVTDSGASA